MLLQFEEWIIISNYALNFIIFNIRLVVYSSSILSQLYPSSPTVSTFSGEDASCHLWFCASLILFRLLIFLCVCSALSCPFPLFAITFFLLLPLWAPMVLWQGHCSQHRLSWHRLGSTPFWALRWTSCYRWLRQQNLFLIIINSAGFLR